MRELDATSLPHPPAEVRGSRSEPGTRVQAARARTKDSMPQTRSEWGAHSLEQYATCRPAAVRHAHRPQSLSSALRTPHFAHAAESLFAVMMCSRRSARKPAPPFASSPLFAAAPPFDAAPPLDAAPSLAAAPPLDAAPLFSSSPLFAAAPPLDAAPTSTLSDPVAGLALFPFAISLSLLSFSAQDKVPLPYPP